MIKTKPDFQRPTVPVGALFGKEQVLAKKSPSPAGAMVARGQAERPDSSQRTLAERALIPFRIEDWEEFERFLQRTGLISHESLHPDVLSRLSPIMHDSRVEPWAKSVYAEQFVYLNQSLLDTISVRATPNDRQRTIATLVTLAEHNNPLAVCLLTALAKRHGDSGEMFLDYLGKIAKKSDFAFKRQTVRFILVAGAHNPAKAQSVIDSLVGFVDESDIRAAYTALVQSQPSLYAPARYFGGDTLFGLGGPAEKSLELLGPREREAEVARITAQLHEMHGGVSARLFEDEMAGFDPEANEALARKFDEAARLMERRLLHLHGSAAMALPRGAAEEIMTGVPELPPATQRALEATRSSLRRGAMSPRDFARLNRLASESGDQSSAARQLIEALHTQVEQVGPLHMALQRRGPEKPLDPVALFGEEELGELEMGMLWLASSPNDIGRRVR